MAANGIVLSPHRQIAARRANASTSASSGRWCLEQAVFGLACEAAALRRFHFNLPACWSQRSVIQQRKEQRGGVTAAPSPLGGAASA